MLGRRREPRLQRWTAQRFRQHEPRRVAARLDREPEGRNAGPPPLAEESARGAPVPAETPGRNPDASRARDAGRGMPAADRRGRPVPRGSPGGVDRPDGAVRDAQRAGSRASSTGGHDRRRGRSGTQRRSAGKDAPEAPPPDPAGGRSLDRRPERDHHPDRDEAAPPAGRPGASRVARLIHSQRRPSTRTGYPASFRRPDPALPRDRHDRWPAVSEDRLHWNCESFARFIRDGLPHSEQAEGAKKVLVGAAVVGGIALALRASSRTFDENLGRYRDRKGRFT